MTSRAGENLFWLGRYTERTEQPVRLARATLTADRRRRRRRRRRCWRRCSALAVRSGLVPPSVPTLAQALARVLRARAAGAALADRRRRGQRGLQPGGAGARVAGAARAPVGRALAA
ncbi:MAG: alpha-E domain-containing protein [Comamonadaceae bacterium]|nr:alpha-E domain-containing protein [Comamonadaceae bacterium]